MMRKYLSLILLVLTSAVVVWGVGAQDVTPTKEPDVPTATLPPVTSLPQQVTPLIVTLIEPATLVSGRSNVISIYGQGFTNNTLVRLTGFGLVSATFVNPGALTATIPEAVPPGVYGVDVSDPVNGIASSPIALTMIAPTQPPPTPLPPQPTAEPTNTLPPPTPIPGQPSLVVRSFRAEPDSVAQGGTTTLIFEVVNQGNRPAQGVSVALGGEARFTPADGMASATVADIPPGGSVTVSLSVVAAADAPVGPNDVPITMTYRDFSGETYTSNANLGVDVTAFNLSSQLVVVRSAVEPQPAVPGDTVEVTLTVANRGNQTAAGALVRITGEGSILIPGASGDTFALGDLAAGATADVSFPMIVRGDTRRGAQAQSVRLIYFRNGEAQETTTSITVQIAEQVRAQPLILLQSYDTGMDDLKPGDRFTLTFTLQNVGTADAEDMLVTFGSMNVSDQPNPPSSDNGTPGAPGSAGSGSNSSTNPSTMFAPLGSGGTLFAGDLPAGGTMTLTQEFIVNANVQSGVQQLPISVRYTTDEGRTGQASLSASMIVLVPPRLQVALDAPLPPTVNVGEPLSINLNIANIGRGNEVIQTAALTAENAEVVDGASTQIGVIRENEDETISGTLIPTGPGTVTFTFTLSYLDDLDQIKTLDYTFTVEAEEPLPPPEIPFDPPPVITPEPTLEPDDWFGRLLLGFLGLGG
ncbi:MAG: CARDB domain-containing protein [Chloroflexota bacterium]|nr:CARDB domain-containing protein [Chloroflexota bacterium]